MMQQSIKTESRDSAGVRFLAWVGMAVIRLLNATLRWEFHSTEEFETSARNGSPMIVVFWHNRQLMMMVPFGRIVRQQKGRRASMLISGHRDGRIIARIIDYFGLHTVMGSSTRGGKEAALELKQELHKGSIIGITPDGPKGPVHQAKAGAIRLSQDCQVPIYPMAYGASRKFIFRSWDRMILPKPFAKVTWLVGDTLHILPDEDFEAARGKVEQALNEITRQADEMALQ